MAAFLLLTACRSARPSPARHAGPDQLECLRQQAGATLPVVRTVSAARALVARKVLAVGWWTLTELGHAGAIVVLEDGTRVYVVHGNMVEGELFEDTLVAVEGFVHMSPPSDRREIGLAPYLTARAGGPSHLAEHFPDQPTIWRLDCR